MFDRVIANFKRHFPLIANSVTQYYNYDDFSICAVLDNGDRIYYYDYDGTFRVLPPDSCDMTETECRSEFGYRLLNLMIRKGVSQIALSEMTGISNVMINRYINGSTTPSFYVVDKIAKALRCSMDDFRYTE